MYIGCVVFCCIYYIGATVHLVCRNQERGESAKTEITRESSNEVRTSYSPPFFNVFTPRKNPLLVPKLISFFRSLQKVHLHLLDLSKPKDITKFTKDFVDSGQQLDVLVSRKQHCTDTQ